MTGDAQVVVVGAGPVGLSTALGLAQRGLSVALIRVARDHDAPLQYVHNWSVLPEFDGLGILDAALRRGSVEPTIRIHLRTTGERIDLDLGVLRDDVPFPFNLHLGQPELCAILEERLQRFPRVEMHEAAAVTELVQGEAGVTVHFESSQSDSSAAVRVRGQWLVAADATNSVIRRRLGLGFPGFTWHERSVVALVSSNAKTSDAGTTFEVDGGHGAIVQKAGPQRWLCTYAEPLELPESTVGARVADSVRHVLQDPAATVLDWQWARMHQRAAEKFRVGRVLLVGEAAHVTTTMTGHSSIAGFFDAVRVTEALAAVVDGRAADDILDTHATDRRRVFLDDAAPISAHRKHLVSDLGFSRLDVELNHYRQAAATPTALRELLLFNHRLAGVSPLAETHS